LANVKLDDRLETIVPASAIQPSRTAKERFPEGFGPSQKRSYPLLNSLHPQAPKLATLSLLALPQSHAGHLGFD